VDEMTVFSCWCVVNRIVLRPVLLRCELTQKDTFSTGHTRTR